MSENRKQEKDYTKEVDEALPEAEKTAKGGKLQDALDKLFVLEKQARNAADLKSTTRLVTTITRLAYEARDYTLLNSSVQTLAKKHGQLKGAAQEMVEQAMGWLDEIRSRDGLEKWLELVETLRTVTEGKLYLETPRARVTLQLAQYYEHLAESPTKDAPRRDSLIKASDLLNDLQVETYSSMERKEKTDFILNQMRLLIEVARIKDAEYEADRKDVKGKDPMGGGESEWVKVRVASRKVNEQFLTDKENEALKLTYYDMMVQYGLRHHSYLDIAKYYRKVWETPSIKEDENGKGRIALEHIVYFSILAPHDNEQSDMIQKLYIDPTIIKLEPQHQILKSFTDEEIMRWPAIEQVYGSFLRGTDVFKVEKHWEDLHVRIIEHNIRIIAKYYSRIKLERLSTLLDLPVKETEDTLSRLVVSATVWARIDRPAGVVNFRAKRDAEEVMNDWSSDMQKLLGHVEKAWMDMNAAQAAQSRVKAQAAAS
ncbi:PCI-domain-containing protein [Peniophora sp. CONT]|nr:PCI-domain-containing protein [Peniophora sp. CONT]